MEYFGEDGDRMHMMFNFQVNQNLFYALASSDSAARSPRALKATMHRPETAQWGPSFLRNHDELDLGRLSEEQRREVFKCFGPEAEHAASTSAASGGGLAPMLRRRPEAHRAWPTA